MNHDDEDIDLALKLAQVDMYTRRLRERARRKRVARDFRLVSLYFNALKKEKEKPTTAAKKREFQKEKYADEQFFVSMLPRHHSFDFLCLSGKSKKNSALSPNSTQLLNTISFCAT